MGRLDVDRCKYLKEHGFDKEGNKSDMYWEYNKSKDGYTLKLGNLQKCRISSTLQQEDIDNSVNAYNELNLLDGITEYSEVTITKETVDLPSPIRGGFIPFARVGNYDLLDALFYALMMCLRK